MKWLAAIFILSCATTAAQAQDLVAGLSQDQIQITSNYTGSDLVVFGAIEQDAESDQSTVAGKRDIVVVIRGPDAPVHIHRKQRIAGIWINNREVTLGGLPSYYYVASSQPLGQVASEDTLERYEIGLDNVAPASATSHKASTTEQFRQAVVRARMRANAYAQAPNGVEFLSYSLFRVHVPVPAEAPRGQYTAEVYLFKDGNVVSAQSTPLFVEQIGLERNLFNFAHNSPLIYGLVTALMALLLGWISSLIFRQTN